MKSVLGERVEEKGLIGVLSERRGVNGKDVMLAKFIRHGYWVFFAVTTSRIDM